MQIYERIRKIRLSRGETQEQIAQILNTAREVVNRYESGKQEIPTRRIRELCLHWEISADYLLGLPDGLDYPKNENKRDKCSCLTEGSSQ